MTDDATNANTPASGGPEGNPEDFGRIEELFGGGSLGKGSPLSEGPAASSLPEQNLEHDRYDMRLWREIREASAELSSLEGDEEAPSTFPALLTDLFLSYFKAQPDLLPAGGVEPRHRLANRPFVERTLEDPDTYRARGTTSLDVAASALSSLAAGERLLEEIKSRPSLKGFFEEAGKEPTFPDAKVGPDARAPEEPEQKDPEGSDTGDRPQEAPGTGLPGRDARRAVRAAAGAGREEAENVAGALAGWGLSPADLKKVPLGERLELLKALSRPEMRRLIELVGRMRNLARTRAREKVAESRDEVHAIELSGDLSRLLPSELALIASKEPLRRLAALCRLAQGRSLSWELTGKKKEKKGPLIALVDSSGSMGENQKMEWATAVALGLVDLAAGRGGLPKRASAVLHFNTSVLSEVRFSPGERGARKLLELATVGPGGGTAYEPPISRALEVARESGYEGADLILITDELCRIGEEFLEGFLAEKEHRKMRLFSVLIGYSSSGELGRYSDRVWVLADLAGTAGAANAAGEVFGLI